MVFVGGVFGRRARRLFCDYMATTILERIVLMTRLCPTLTGSGQGRWFRWCRRYYILRLLEMLFVLLLLGTLGKRGRRGRDRGRRRGSMSLFRQLIPMLSLQPTIRIILRLTYLI